MTAALTTPTSKSAAPRRRAAVVCQTAAAAGLWGSVGPLVALYPSTASDGFAIVRLVLGAGVLALLASRSTPMATLSRRDLPILLVGGLSVAAFQPLYFAAVHQAGIAVATFIAIGLSPVATGVAVSLQHGIAPARRWWAGSATAITGLGLLAGGVTSGQPGAAGTGILLAVLACVSYSIQALAIDRLTTTHGEPHAVGAIFIVGALMLLPTAALADWAWLGQPPLLLGGLYAGVVTLAVAYRLFARGVARLGPPTAVLISLLEPVAAGALAILLVGERLGPVQVTAALLVMIGVVLSVTGKRAHCHPT